MTRYDLPSIPYIYDALEPHIDAKTMESHHTKHHQTYINNLNAALEKCHPEIQNKDILEILSNLDQVTNEVKGVIIFNVGGFDNHRIFWNNLSPNDGGELNGVISDAINSSFGSFASFKENFSSSTIAIQGRGWVWFVYNPFNRNIEYKAMPNQTSPRTED